MRKLIVYALMLSALPGFASAADIINPEPAPAPVAFGTPERTWSGIYLGVLLGYTIGESDVSGGGSVDVDGIDGGVYAGYNYQTDNWVAGVEADALLSGVEGSSGGVNVEQTWSGSLRVRAGYSLQSFLLYGTGGLALTEVEASSGGASDSNTHLGWTLGAGIEGMITDNVTARVEYRYTDYEDKTFNLGAPTGADLNTSTVRAGVGVKF